MFRAPLSLIVLNNLHHLRLCWKRSCKALDEYPETLAILRLIGGPHPFLLHEVPAQTGRPLLHRTLFGAGQCFLANYRF